MHNQLLKRIDFFLYQKRFFSPAVRFLLSVQLLITTFSCIIGLLACYFSLWPLLFSVGAALAAMNFWFISRFADMHLTNKFSLALALQYYVGFFLRFIFTGFICFAVIFFLKASIIPVLAGISSLLFAIFFWCLLKHSPKSTEEA